LARYRSCKVRRDQEPDGSRVESATLFSETHPFFRDAVTWGVKFAARTFSVETALNPTSLLARTKKAASESGATLIGDEQSGRFSHEMVRGEYRIVGQTVIVTITDKHWLLPWPVVESQLRKLIQQ